MPYSKRIAKAIRTLRTSEPDAAIVLSTAVAPQRSSDVSYQHRPGNDFFYFTGSKLKEGTLLITKDSAFLLAPNPSEKELLWEGFVEKPKKTARTLGIDWINTTAPIKELKEKLKGYNSLYFTNLPGTAAKEIVETFLAIPAGTNTSYPRTFSLAEAFTEELRIIKDRNEVKLISEAIKITYDSLSSIMPLIGAGATEAEINAALSYHFKLRNSEAGFSSIIASGHSAATLHYEQMARKLKVTELLLIDCGAEKGMYSADITRCFPVSGKFSGWQKDLYSIVLSAQKAAIARVRDGVRMKTVYNAALRKLIKGLIELGVLKGTLESNLKSEKWRKYFPHGIGHGLGLDIHDLGRTTRGKDFLLRSGMVITIEPGLYFSKQTAELPACGVRIEDDILVTKDSQQNLSSSIPKEIKDIENWMSF